VIRLSQVKGRRVVARDNAQVVGTIRRLHLDVATARIVGIELDGAIDRDTIVEWPAVVAVDSDALMIDNASDRREPLDKTEKAFVAGEFDLEGKLVMNDTGDALGRLEDLAYDEKTGRVIELFVPGQVIPVEGIVALGSYALIIAAPAQA
jgi:sporulation protein YlmC with PRC-barrel domain